MMNITSLNSICFKHNTVKGECGENSQKVSLDTVDDRFPLLNKYLLSNKCLS